MADSKYIDPEKGSEEDNRRLSYTEKHYAHTTEGNAVPGESFEIGDSYYARMQRLAGRFHVEQRGIERVPENERTDLKPRNAGTMWLAANMVVSSFAIGVLGQAVFYLSFKAAALTIVFINLLGITPVCFFSTFGPRFGLRQMVLSRFWFGWYGVKIIACFNVLACIGWSSVNVIVGAQLLYAVQDKLPGPAGIVIIAIMTFIITLFGYKIVHAYEKWSWIPCFIIFLVVLGEFCHQGHFTALPTDSGAAEAGSVLSFAATVFGFATGWTSYAADYTVYQPSTTSRKSVFLWTWLGLIFPLCFTELLGAAVITGVNSSTEYADGYKNGGIGGLLRSVLSNSSLSPGAQGFGKFCLVILALSIVANNCPNIYSVSLTLQVMARWTQRVPRFVWTLIGTCVYIAIAIPGYSHFETVLTDFMLLIGYWLAIYQGISLPEHIIFRRGMTGYVPEDYDNPNRLPVGAAAMFAFCCGIAGAVLGMSQVWFVGPLAKLAGPPPYGGDIGFELAFGFACVAYCVLRPIEKSFFKR